MPAPEFASLLLILEAVFRPVLTRPSFRNLVLLVAGWVQTTAPSHTVTESLLAAHVAGRRHHAAFHRFFSRATWDPDTVGYWLVLRLVDRIGEGALRIVIDDTIASKKGPHVFGLGTHVDAVRSTKRYRVFTFGHCWVVLAVLVRVPFSHRAWALPVLFRLYRNKKECAKNSADYRKKTELAREMLDVVCRWVKNRRIEVTADSAYCNDTVTRDLPARVVLFGNMRPDAVLTALPGASGASTGRPRKRGETLPKPTAFAEDPSEPWLTCTANIYGGTKTVRYKTLCGQWYRACGVGVLRVVIVAMSTGAIPYRVFFCTDASLDVPTILETYAERWGIEVFFREAKQMLGFADSPARTRNAVLRTAPFVGLVYSVLVLWFVEGASASPMAALPVRPWYTHKRGRCFADVLRAARRVLGEVRVFDLASNFNNLDKVVATPSDARERAPDIAA
jgi:hypothetical protein